jgi:hypothetical protein
LGNYGKFKFDTLDEVKECIRHHKCLSKSMELEEYKVVKMLTYEEEV